MMSRELREVHSEVLVELAKSDSNVMVLEADLASCITTNSFAKKYPDNFIQCGIAEANMIGVAAGLSAVGKIPFVHSFGCFVTRRCFDQIFLSGGYARQHISIFGSDAGVTAVTNGGTHMPFEDIGLMRLVPDSVIIDVSDEYVLRAAIKFAYKHKGVNYIRSTRKDLPVLYQAEQDVEIGKANVMKEGTDLTLVACGICVHDALEAANELEARFDGSVAVIDMHTIKPLDGKTLRDYVSKSKKVVTIENHNIIGGLGESVANELVCNNIHVEQFLKLGVNEKFGQVGSLDYLKESYGISASAIVSACEPVLAS